MTATVETSVGTYRLQDGRLQVRWKSDDQWRLTEMGYEVHHYPNGGMEIRPQAMPFAPELVALIQGSAPSEAPSDEADAERMAILAEFDRYEDRSDMPRTWHEGIHWARKIIMQRSLSALRAAPAPPAESERRRCLFPHRNTMIDISRHPVLRQAHSLCLAIEELPASEQQTRCAVAASDLLRAISAAVPSVSAADRGGEPSAARMRHLVDNVRESLNAGRASQEEPRG